MDYNKIITLVTSTKEIATNLTLKSNVSVKGNCDFVTEIDYKISDYLKKNLKELYPDIAFMSEEETTQSLPSKRWILDPIDGTTNLIYNYNLSSISLALLDGNEIVFGVVYNPFNDELFYAIKNQGAYFNGNKLEKIKDRLVKDSLIEFGAGSSIKTYASETFDLAKEIFVDCLDIRRMCSSALAICYIAIGRLNGYFERKLLPWDYAAGSLILSECGGVLSDFNGEKLQFDTKTSIICGSQKVYDYLLKKVNKFN